VRISQLKYQATAVDLYCLPMTWTVRARSGAFAAPAAAIVAEGAVRWCFVASQYRFAHARRNLSGASRRLNFAVTANTRVSNKDWSSQYITHRAGVN
jgi:hypothetical protein